jgi:hypothetical protein
MDSAAAGADTAGMNQVPPPPGGPPQPNPYAPPAGSWAAEPPGAHGVFGDAAGEHLVMKRGEYSAWPYVVLAFLYEATLTGVVPGGISGFLADAAGAKEEVAGAAVIAGTVVFGFPLAYLVFRDRWRCIEAYSSRFCVGIMNVSLFHVPFFALVYANVRGFRKLVGK